MYIVAICKDRKDAGALRKATRADHLSWISEQAGAVKLAGALLDEDAKIPVGSLIVIEAADVRAAEAVLREDPYALAGLFASVELAPWNWVIGNPDTEEF